MKKLHLVRQRVFGLCGFTLVELLVVIAIIAILSSLIIGGFRSSQRRSRDAARKSDLKQIAGALEMIYSDHQRYPASDASGNVLACNYNPDNPNGSGACEYGVVSEDNIMSDGETTYMRSIPGDPSGSTYFYRSVSNGAGFQIFAHLENSEDQNCVNDSCSADIVIGGTTISCGTDLNCNFAVTSPNVSPTENTLL